MAQQRWLRTLNIEHRRKLPGTSASMAPGSETSKARAESQAAPNYRAKRGAPDKNTVAASE